MSRYLWSRSNQEGDDSAVQDFMSGEDILLDRELFLFDIEATQAHAGGLHQIGVLTADELEQISRSLDRLAQQFTSGSYELGPPLEDGHSAIELFLTQEIGEVGRKVHTGRSRNDQVQVALRLYMRTRLGELGDVCRNLSKAFLARAELDEFTAMPGYTHLQRAVPSSVGLWLAAFAESYLDIGLYAAQTRDWLNTCPLGTAAGYGVNLPLAREEVARKLGFARLQVNPMYVQNSRGRFELAALECLSQATLELRRFCWDISLYTSQEFGFVSLPAQFITGSSIMPNKSNPDFAELARAQHAVVQGARTEIESVLGLPSGYQRDLQRTKPPLLRAFGSSLPALRFTIDLVGGMEFDREAMLAAIDGAMFSTDIAVNRVTESGMAFRDAYRQPVSQDETKQFSAEQSIKNRVSPGACASLDLDKIRERLKNF